jgi:hypothetical protein
MDFWLLWTPLQLWTAAGSIPGKLKTARQVFACKTDLKKQKNRFRITGGNHDVKGRAF